MLSGIRTVLEGQGVRSCIATGSHEAASKMPKSIRPIISPSQSISSLRRPACQRRFSPAALRTADMTKTAELDQRSREVRVPWLQVLKGNVESVMFDV